MPELPIGVSIDEWVIEAISIVVNPLGGLTRAIKKPIFFVHMCVCRSL
jgi:hypothetical protein